MESKYSAKMVSINQEYETPDKLYQILDNEFHFKCDLAGSELNKKHNYYLSKDDDAFKHDWYGINWLNPPFNKVGKWVRKAYEDSEKYKSTIVMLILVKSNTNWWRDYVMKAKEVKFINQKIQFKNTEQGLRFPACIVIFQPHLGETKFSVMESCN